MAPAARFLGFDRFDWLQFGDLHAEFVWTFDKMFPLERCGPLRGKLVIQRHGIVVVQQDEVIADRQLQPSLNY